MLLSGLLTDEPRADTMGRKGEQTMTIFLYLLIMCSALAIGLSVNAAVEQARQEAWMEGYREGCADTEQHEQETRS